MSPERGVSSLAIDLSQLHRRTVTSFYSNLVTRPTGRAVRTGVESQLAELDGAPGVHLSILDFAQVRVLDYSCADEIVAKLLLRFASADRPADAYFLVRGLQEHHREAIEAVLERHDLLVVVEDEGGLAHLVGPCNPVERACWNVLHRLGRPTAAEVAAVAGMPEDAVRPTLARFTGQRVALALPEARYASVALLGSL